MAKDEINVPIALSAFWDNNNDINNNNNSYSSISYRQGCLTALYKIMST